ncbi:MAG: hypothetical protein F4029_10930 [Gammaproteobacteria bacterium]|nr:hypothetical protein [Gammaproteobacteria bacterium]MYF30352.1 hypothetical protein [Gammaproteobacteria bacterium]MYK46728.1 hypothetical protein [Gammaproteobacteria bacterium]
MNGHDARPDAGAPGERIAALCSAILRIGASLDPDTVLRAAVDGARDLTGARLGMIATVDEAGTPDGFVESGFTPEEAAELAIWPDRGHLPVRAPALADGDAARGRSGSLYAQLGACADAGAVSNVPRHADAPPRRQRR